MADLSSHRDALIAALIDLEHHVAEAGWDQVPRLFALVRTEVLVASEPALAEQLGLQPTADDALTAVEQDTFASSGDVVGDLSAIEWPQGVFGCAISLVRTFLPAAYEADLPADPAAAAAAVAVHPERQEIRVVVGVDRSGHRHGVARLVSQPDQLLAGDDLVPGLAAALTHTLTSHNG
ncbi:MAG TPA: PPA1309 family protein [Propionibacteriaceae bacterium]